MMHTATTPRPAGLAVKIIPNDNGNPPGKLADAELHFTDDPLADLKLIGFAIWERRGGNGRNVTFPARQYSVNGERRSFALLRPIADTTAQNRLRDAILVAYEDYEHIVNAELVGPTTAFARDMADAIKAAAPVAEAPYALTPEAAATSAVQTSEPLPADTFKDSGTSVRTRLVIVVAAAAQV